MDIILVILIIVILFQISRIKDSIINGKYLLSSIQLTINKIIICLQILEHANPGAYFIIRLKTSFQTLKIFKEQGKAEWWFEICVPESNVSIFKTLLSIQGIPETVNSKNNTFILGSDKEKILKVISQYFNQAYGSNDNTIVRIIFKRTRIEESITQVYFTPDKIQI